MPESSNSEILQIVEAVAKEKGIARESLLSAMEQAIAVAGRQKYGNEENIKAEISRKNGEIKLYKVLEVVESQLPENYSTTISLEEAQTKKPDVQVGEEIHELLPPIEIGRVAAQAAKQVIVQRVSDEEREKQYHDFKGREGEILTGIVKRIEFGNIIVDLGRAEGIIKKDQLIKNESYKINDRIKVYVQEVRLEPKGPQIFLSRSDNLMLAKLFEIEVPEIQEQAIEIKAIARDPGSKAKIAVFAADTNIDALGSCVGIRGNRVKAITTELNGEKIDVILWSKNLAQFVINAMAPAEISKIVLDEASNRVEVVVPNEQLSIAIGRGGQNVRLAAKLVGCKIDVMTEEQQSKKQSEEFGRIKSSFMQVLDVEEIIAELLSAEGYTSVDEIAVAELSELSKIQGFDEDLASELKSRAEKHIEAKNEEIISKLELLGVEQELLNVLNLPAEDILTLAQNGIKTLEDLADTTVKEFQEILPNSNLLRNDIHLLILQAKSQIKE